MAGSVDLHLNIANSLQENLESSTKSLGSMTNIAEDLNKSMGEATKSSNMLNDDYDDIAEDSGKASKNTDKLASGLGKAVGFAKKIATGALGFMGLYGLSSVVTDVLALNQEMSNLSYRMGEAGKTARQLEDAVTDVGMATGVSTEVAMGWITELRQLRVATDDVEELATAGIRFGKITGASAASTEQLIGKLTTMGGLGSKSIQNVMGNIVSMQRAFGLTSAEVENVSESIVKSTQQLKQMGKSTAEVTKFSTGVSKLAGAFASVGIEASLATQTIEKLLDPGAIEENAFLFAKLGVSMDDAINGNIDPAQLVGGFKDLGAELKNMSGPAAAAMAQSLGMPLNQLRQMAEMDMDELNKAFGGMGEGSEKLAAEQKEQAKAQEKLAEMGNTFKNALVKIGTAVMPIINTAVEFLANNMDKFMGVFSKFMDSLSGGGAGKLMKIAGAIAAGLLGLFLIFKKLKTKFFSINTEVGQNLRQALETGMEEAMTMGADKSSVKMEEKMKASTSRYMKDLQQRIIEGTDYAATKASSSFYKSMSETNLTKGAQGLVEWTSKWLDTISAGAKPVSLIGKSLDESTAKIMNNMNLERENNAILTGQLDIVKNSAKENMRGLIERRNELKEIEKTEGLSADRQWELVKVQKELSKERKTFQKTTQELADLELQSDQRRIKSLKNISLEERKRMSDAIAGEIQLAKDQKTRIQGEQAANDLTIDVLTNSQKALDDEIKSYNEMGKLSLDQIAKQQEMIAQRKINNELLSEEIQRKDSLHNQQEEMNKSLEQNTKELKLIKSTSEDIANTDPNIKFKTFGEKIKGVFSQARGNIVEGINGTFNKVQNSFRESARALKEVTKPSNIKKAISAAGGGNFWKGLGTTLKKGAKSMGSSVSKAGKAIGKSMKGFGGPLMLLAGLFLTAMKDLDSFKNIMTIVKDAIKKVVTSLEPAIQELIPVFQNVIDSLMPLVEVLADVVGPILGILGGILEILMPIFIELVKILMPPLLIVLGLLLNIIGFLITQIGNLAQIIVDMGFGDATAEEQKMVNSILKTGEDFSTAGSSMVTLGKEMREQNKAADSFGVIQEYTFSGEKDMVDAVKSTAENTNPESETVTRELYPAVIEAASSGFVKTQNAREVITGSAEKIRDIVAEETRDGITFLNESVNKLIEVSTATAEATATSAEAAISNVKTPRM